METPEAQSLMETILPATPNLMKYCAERKDSKQIILKICREELSKVGQSSILNILFRL